LALPRKDEVLLDDLHVGARAHRVPIGQANVVEDRVAGAVQTGEGRKLDARRGVGRRETT